MMTEEKFAVFARRDAILKANTMTVSEIASKARSVVRGTKFRSLPRQTQEQYRPILAAKSVGAEQIQALTELDEIFAGRRSDKPKRNGVEVVGRANTTVNRNNRNQGRRRQAANSRAAA